jgi:hypothetical protein
MISRALAGVRRAPPGTRGRPLVLTARRAAAIGACVVHDAEPSPTTAAGTCRARVYLGSVNRAWNFAARPLVSRSELPENFHGFAREPTWPQAGITVAIARSHDGSNAEPDERTATDTGANSIALGHRRRSR